MDAGILRALKTVKDNRYVQYVGIGLAGLVTQEDHMDKETGKPLRKTKYQLIRISAAVCGIELCYAAETAFVSPILLKLGVPASLMTMVWCLSPIIGFFLVPVMGSMSDRCRLKIGRRRPFIMILSIGIILGLALVPNGQSLGVLMGDSWDKTLIREENTPVFPITTTKTSKTPEQFIPLSQQYSINNTVFSEALSPYTTTTINTVLDGQFNDSATNNNSTQKYSLSLSFVVPREHLRGIILTILGVALLDFNCDACQSPCRAYLLDVSVPEDHSQGLTMFTVMAGAGGAVGYMMGGIDWNSTSFGEAFGGHIRVVFSIVLVAFVVCMASTLTSFKETPLSELDFFAEKLQRKSKKKDRKKYKKFTNEEDSPSDDESCARKLDYGTISESTNRSVEVKGSDKKSNFGKGEGTNALGYASSINETNHGNTKSKTEDLASKDIFSDTTQHAHMNGQINSVANSSRKDRSSLLDLTESEISPYTMRGAVSSQSDDVIPTVDVLEVSTDVTLKTYLRSIVRMPKCLWLLCLTNLFCWMSLACYSLYFTDFVGQAVYRGNPQAPFGSVEHNMYDEGIRLGSMGMSLYSLSCACYSLVIEKLVQRFRAKRVYVIGQLVYTVGMLVMAASKSKVAVIVMSPTAGIMYATLFTMPYLLVAHYHSRGMFSQSGTLNGEERQVRGLGTDVAIVSSMVFLAQFLLSVFMGTAVSLVGSTTTVVIASSVLSFLGAITATQVTYLDL